MDSIVEMQDRRAARFEKAVLPHLDHIYCAALLLTRDLHNADDLVLGTFAHAYESFHQVQRGTDVRAWLYRALSSTFTETSEWQQAAPLPMATDKPGYPQLADAEGPIPFGTQRRDSEALNQLPDSDIRKALQALPAHLRLTVYLADVEGYTYADIADIVEAPIPTVASRLQQGRRLLRGLLLRHAGTAAAVRLQRR